MHDEHNTEQSEDAAPPDEAAAPSHNAAPQDETAPRVGIAPPPDDAPPSDDAPAPDTATLLDATARGADGAQTGPSEKTGPSEVDDVARLRRERDKYYERLLRTTADFDNYRKRTDRERRELTQYAATALLTDLLPLVDDLERALAVDTQDGEVDRRGVEIIHKQLLDLLDKQGVTGIEALGADFDPNLHQAVAHEPSEAHRDGEVIEELRRGYTQRDRLLRASMVKVAKA